MTQLQLSNFVNSLERAGRRRRGFSSQLLVWEVEYIDYQRSDPEIEAVQGYVLSEARIELREALIRRWNPQARKKTQWPGFVVSVSKKITYPDGPVTNLKDCILNESKLSEKTKAVDAFRNAVLNVESWILIAQARVRLIPRELDALECMGCGWVTDDASEDITCPGCGNKFWFGEAWRCTTQSKGEVV